MLQFYSTVSTVPSTIDVPHMFVLLKVCVHMERQNNLFMFQVKTRSRMSVLLGIVWGGVILMIHLEKFDIWLFRVALIVFWYWGSNKTHSLVAHIFTLGWAKNTNNISKNPKNHKIPMKTVVLETFQDKFISL